MIAPLSHELAQTLPRWWQLIARVTGLVTALLLKRKARVEKLPPPLPESNSRADGARRQSRGRAKETNPAKLPRRQRRYKRSGDEVPSRERAYREVCLTHYKRDRNYGFVRAGRASFAEQRADGVDASHGWAERRCAGVTG